MYRFRSYFFLVTAAVWSLASIASAHPGHGTRHSIGEGVAHPFFGLDHLLAMACVGLIASTWQRRWALPILFVMGMIVGGAVSVYGETSSAFRPTSMVEQMIAASVFVFGLSLAATASTPAITRYVAGIAVPAFAVFHGYAHFAEGVQGSASLLAYGVGMVLATLLLLVIGIKIGLFIQRRPRAPLVGRLTGSMIAGAGMFLLARTFTA